MYRPLEYEPTVKDEMIVIVIATLYINIAIG